MAFMHEGAFPQGCADPRSEYQQKELLNCIFRQFESGVARGTGQGLASLSSADIKDVIEKQRASFDLQSADAQAVTMHSMYSARAMICPCATLCQCTFARTHVSVARAICFVCVICKPRRQLTMMTKFRQVHPLA